MSDRLTCVVEEKTESTRDRELRKEGGRDSRRDARERVRECEKETYLRVSAANLSRVLHTDARNVKTENYVYARNMRKYW